MSIAWDDLPRLQMLIHKFPDVMLVPLITILLDKAQQEPETLLIGQPVERTGQTIQ
jgi:hypothetical protein